MLCLWLDTNILQHPAIYSSLALWVRQSWGDLAKGSKCFLSVSIFKMNTYYSNKHQLTSGKNGRFDPIKNAKKNIWASDSSIILLLTPIYPHPPHSAEEGELRNGAQGGGDISTARTLSLICCCSIKVGYREWKTGGIAWNFYGNRGYITVEVHKPHDLLFLKHVDQHHTSSY